MYTPSELQMLENANPGASIPGIGAPAGNPLAAAPLEPLSALPTSTSAPIYYIPSSSLVVVNQAGATLSGYDFGSADVYVRAANVTIKDCNFTASAGYSAIGVQTGYANTTITGNTFNGAGVDTELGAWIQSHNTVTITDNRFIDTPSDGIDVTGGGVISGNYFSGAGYTSNGGHPDAIWVTDSTAPLAITGNFIDWTTNADSNQGANNCIRITAEKGSVSNVTVSGNDMIGGSYSVDAGNTGPATGFSNITITNNWMGFAQYGAFFNGPAAGTTVKGNVVFDWTDPAYSANARAAYTTAGVPTPYILYSASGAAVTAASSPGPTTLYGSPNATLWGGSHENNFVGGFGAQSSWGGVGANIFTYLSPGDATVANPDQIANFDPAKDVIDLGHIDANLSPGVAQNVTFIGANAFTAAGAQVRCQQNAAYDATDVLVSLAGDSTPTMKISIRGLVTLTAANFALTAAQSQTDLTNGAALAVASASGSGYPLTEYLYTNVTGRNSSSYAAFYARNMLVADALNLSASTGEIDLFDTSGNANSAVTVTRGNGQESISAQGKTLSMACHAKETIQTGGGAANTFAFGAGFGAETIDGFATSGTNADTLQLSAAAFSTLTPGMTQAQDLAAVLANATCSASATTIADSHGDSLTLAGLTAATLTANPSAVRFV